MTQVELELNLETYFKSIKDDIEKELISLTISGAIDFSTEDANSFLSTRIITKVALENVASRISVANKKDYKNKKNYKNLQKF